MRPDDPHDPDLATRRAPWPRRVAVFCLLLPSASGFLATGCRGLGQPDTKYDLLTAELRTREREIREIQAERDHLRALLQAYQRSAPGCPPSPDANVPGALREIALGAGTGGVDDDRLPGDESLMVVVVPRDEEGTAVKVPARVAVTAYEVSREGIKTPLGRWEVPPEQLRRTWRNGLISSGYFIPLQWDRPPSANRLRVVAELTLPDGRRYEADKDVTVRPLPGVGPTLPPGSVPDSPPGAEELPPPATPAARLKPLSPTAPQ